jgi:hypothetical protein
MSKHCVTLAFCIPLLAASVRATAQTDPLPSWNDGAAKKAIVEFVQATTAKSSPKFVPPEERFAAFDQDGTLWVSHPMYTQVVYCLDRVPAVVKAKPELAKVEPFKTVLSGDRAAMAKLTTADLEKILAATLTGMPVDEFTAEAKKWLETARDPRWKRPYTRAHLPADDRKPEGIHLMIGRRPYAAFGNSTGDRQMPEYTTTGDGARLAMLVLHDDAKREYAYGPAQGLPDTKIGTFPQALYDEAKRKGWIVISMQNDWKRIFAFDNEPDAM